MKISFFGGAESHAVIHLPTNPQSRDVKPIPAPVSEEMEAQGNVCDPVQSSADGETRLGS